jgi:hypothetical protein
MKADQIPRVAVIAIHGVGDHEPSEMARAVGSLLSAVEDTDNSQPYPACREVAIRIPVEPVILPNHREWSRNQDDQGWGPLDAALHERIRGYDRGKPLDYLFLEGQLAGYRNHDPGANYSTTRLEGERRGPSGRAHVHIYDMTWSDLSGVGRSAIGILTELYQLLFHLASVGANTVKAARYEMLGDTAGRKLWKVFDWVHVSTVATLAWPVALLNLILLGFALPVVATLATVSFVPTYLPRLAIALIGLLTLATLFAILRWLPPWLSPVAAVPLLPLFLRGSSLEEWAQGVVTATACLIALGLSIWLVMGYDSRRPGSLRAYLVCLFAVLTVAVVLTPTAFMHETSAHYAAVRRCLLCCEVTLLALFVSWNAFAFLNIASSILAAVTAIETKNLRSAAARACRTARLTVSISGALFLIVTVIFWAGFVRVANGVLPHADELTPLKACNSPQNLCYTPIPFNAQPKPVSELILNTLADSGTFYLACLLVVLGVAGLLCVWGFGPSILTEVFAPEPKSTSAESRRISSWLDHAYSTFVPLAGLILELGLLLFPFAVLFGFLEGEFKPPRDISEGVARALGSILVGAGIGLFAFGGRLTRFVFRASAHDPDLP